MTIQQPSGGGGGSLWTPLHDDDFSANRLAEYTAVEGTSKTGLVVSGGVLSFSDALDHQMRVTNVPVTDEWKMTVKINPNAGNLGIVGLSKWVSTGNEILAQWQAQAGQLTFYSIVGGAATSLGTLAIQTLTGRPSWVVLRGQGRIFRAEVHRMDPRFRAFESNSQRAISAAEATDPQMTAWGTPQGWPKLRIGGWNGTASVASAVTVEELIVAVPNVGANRLDF